MDDGISNQDSKSIIMGATGNPNAGRIAYLQEKKRLIEESLIEKTSKLKELCLQEAEITGVIPSEMPLEPGESPPCIRRKVGTSFTLPEDLLKNTNHKSESIPDLELHVKLHAKLAEAALGLTKKHNLSKTLKRQHKAEYQFHKQEHAALQEKIALLKEAHTVQQLQSLIVEQQKQKKKPRPIEQDDGVSLRSESFGKSELRNSSRSMRHTLQSDNVADLYPQLYNRMTNRNSDIARYDDLSLKFTRLNSGVQHGYLERKDNINNIHPAYSQIHTDYRQHSPTYQQSTPLQPHSPLLSHISLQQHSPLSQHSSFSQHSPLLQHTPLSQHNSLPQYSPLPQHSSFQSSSNLQQSYYNPHIQQYTNTRHYPSVLNTMHYKYNNNNPIVQLPRQSSPNLNNSNPLKVPYAPLNTPQVQLYRYHSPEQSYRTLTNPHQIQPHQQYEHNVMAFGLGGCWTQNENGESVWCATNNVTDYKDKRFGSLDRRKNRRIHKRISPNVDNKSATLPGVPYYPDHVRTATIKPSQVPNANRTSQESSRQLMRTQSLGSVGVQTVDSVWPSDDNSSCESDNRSTNDLSNQNSRKPKSKEWVETSLDGPVSPDHSIVFRSQSAAPSVLAPEEKYLVSPHASPMTMTMPKPPLEIPAESNPSARLPDANLELFNNNIPKNGTLVEAGRCKPYHEETKPFEMSDFYKYSTKFKKSPVKNDQDNHTTHLPERSNVQKNLATSFDDNKMQPTNCSPQITLDLSQLPSTNPSEHYTSEMHPWYGTHDRKLDNNNATLV